jgi:hypothetical protein
MATRAGGWLQRGVRPQQCPKLKQSLANQDAHKSKRFARSVRTAKRKLNLNGLLKAFTSQVCELQNSATKYASAKSKNLMWPNDPKLSHGANNCKREFANKCKMQEQPPLAPARC